MNDMQIHGKFKGEIEVKRFYLPGIKFTELCPKCSEPWEFDGDSEYISNPVVGEPEKVHAYCCECEHEWERKIVLNVTVEAFEK